MTSEALAPVRRPARIANEVPNIAAGPPGAATRPSERVDARFGFEPHNCFACGSLNKNGLHLELHVDGARCWTSLAIPDRFQGWNDIAHGGIVATLLDEVMAWSLVDHDNWGLTARLQIEFKRPVPVGRTVLAEGWVTDARRRVISTAGRIVDSSTGEVLTTALATYVAAPEDRKRELKQRYGYRPITQDTDGR